MEDGDDDTHLTANGKTWKVIDEFSKNTIESKDENEDLEEYNLSSLSEHNDIPLVDSSHCHYKQDPANQEIKSKVSCSESNVVEDQFVDDSSDELQNMARVSLPVSESGEESEENIGGTGEEKYSDSCEISQIQHLGEEEEKISSSVEEAKNYHSSVGEEEEEVLEEKKKEGRTQEYQTFESSEHSSDVSKTCVLELRDNKKEKSSKFDKDASGSLINADNFESENQVEKTNSSKVSEKSISDIDDNLGISNIVSDESDMKSNESFGNANIESGEPVKIINIKRDEPTEIKYKESCEIVEMVKTGSYEPLATANSENDELFESANSENDELFESANTSNDEPVEITNTESSEVVEIANIENDKPVEIPNIENDEPVEISNFGSDEPNEIANAGNDEPGDVTNSEGSEPVTSVNTEGNQQVELTNMECNQDDEITNMESDETVEGESSESGSTYSSFSQHTSPDHKDVITEGNTNYSARDIEKSFDSFSDEEKTNEETNESKEEVDTEIKETIYDFNNADSPISVQGDASAVKTEPKQAQKSERSKKLDNNDGIADISENNSHVECDDSDFVALKEEDNFERDNLTETLPKKDELCCESDKETTEIRPIREDSDELLSNCMNKETVSNVCEKSNQSDNPSIRESTSFFAEQDSDVPGKKSPPSSLDLDINVMSEKSSNYPKQSCDEISIEDEERAISNSFSIIHDSPNVETAKGTEMSVKINGEIESTNVNLQNDTDAGSFSKSKISLKRKLSDTTEEKSSDNSPPESIRGNVLYKGFKKQYIAQVTEESSKETPDLQAIVQEETITKNKRPTKKLMLESPQVLVSHQPLPEGTRANTPLTEYAQYLGLQPTVKFKCYNCGESGFPSMLKLQEHQNICLKNIRIHTYTKPPPTPIVEPAPSTNFRITRKVYLCSACGTYYENWNLFLHMREVHKRHICLFCLLMFSQADKLAQHLSAKHGIVDSSYNSPELFLNEFKGSFFVMCCACEQMFSERDDFFDHMCKDTSVINTDQACSLCGLKGAHFPTCRRAFTESSSLSSPTQKNQQIAADISNTDSPQNPQMQEKPITASKHSTQNDKVSSGKKTFHKTSEQKTVADKGLQPGDVEDDYDISDAASYCHVNIHEPDKQKTGTPRGENVNNTAAMNNKNIESENLEVEQCCEEKQGSDSEDKLMNDENMRSQLTNKERCLDVNESQLKNENSETPEKDEEIRELENDEKQNTQTILSTDTRNKTEQEAPLVNQSKSSKDDGASESDTSGSEADSHDSDGSSSSSEASSDENDQDEKEPPKTEKSEDSDVEKSDSDKMSIVVDETRSDDEVNTRENASNVNIANTPKHETNEVNEHINDDVSETDSTKAHTETNNPDLSEDQQDNIQIAGDDVPLLELTLEESLDNLPIQNVVKECVKISCSTCVYCNHAKKIAVNGKQLVLHLLAEHRFEPVVCSDSGELTPIIGFVDNLKANLTDLQDMFFNTDSYDSTDKHFNRPYDRTYECFHCHFITTLHKELYVHNRKMHQKTILLCIMCKSNFYSYSELLCHLCPGIYVPDSNILFRCCLCVVDGLPSAFRLMVHLRKRHHACDVCLETTGDQQKLSNHVWKHKLHHLCYRCGIAYRNKPDITKHLFWKHGTESVLCKKCLQKKWPHVYHFCIPPTAFLCEECNASFSRAVALKVHKRFHTGDISYQCDDCEEKFISKKLLRRHKERHKQIEENEDNNENAGEHETRELEQDEEKSQGSIVHVNDQVLKQKNSECITEETNPPDISKDNEGAQTLGKELGKEETNKVSDEIKNNKKSKVVDVYDLPPLNLSSESDDSDEEPSSKPVSKTPEPEEVPKMETNDNEVETLDSQPIEPPTEEDTQPVQIVDGVWDNFKTYKANLEKREILQAQVSEGLKVDSSTPVDGENSKNLAIVDVVMADHDYCVLPEKQVQENNLLLTEEANESQQPNAVDNKGKENLDEKSGFGADHNYCFNTSPRSEDKTETNGTLSSLPTNLPNLSPSLNLAPLSNPAPLSPPPPPTPSNPLGSSPKKKQKSPKKKQKQSGSSSSSDSSSNSDTSSCTCGTNCSCSSSSSSSSGSSSSSSDSDSSSSEGRRRQAARREHRRERAKRKLETGSKGGSPPPAAGRSTPCTETGGIAVDTTTPSHIDSSGAGSLQVDDNPVVAAPEPEESEFLIRESDLDTTETDTDEDFYDKYPQKQANKLLAEKRNQLLLLAAVAPVNNGTIAQPSPPPPPVVQESEPVQRKKVKTKRHKKGQHNSSEKKMENKLKLNIPSAYYHSPTYSVSSVGHSASPLTNSQTPVAPVVSRIPIDTYSPANPEAPPTPTAYHSTGSGSETESKRLSKRKRIPKKFYGDSSDEEADHALHQPYKWRKVVPASTSTPLVQSVIPSVYSYRPIQPPAPPAVQSLPPEKSDDEDGDESDSGQEVKRSSSDSSNSDSDKEQSDADSDVETVTTVANTVSSGTGNATQQKNENLYCYCQCPYDEVSEMIACDGKDCSIEWFHFECVGIMVPPKGKWFCPDCRRKTAARSEYLLHA